MTELEPLFDGCDEFERALLRSLQSDTPPPRSLPKTLAALGIGASVLTGAAGASAATGTVAGSTFSAWTVLKALGIGALAGTIVSAAAGTLTSGPSVSPSATASTVVRAAAPTAVAAPRVHPAEESIPPSPADPVAVPEPPALAVTAPSSAAPRARPEASEPAPVANAALAPAAPAEASPASTGSVATFAPVPSEPAARTASATSIAEEVQTLDRARQALAAGRAGDALKEANAHAQRWPNGSLSIEALVVRIEAELALGNRGAAARDARAVIAAHPGSRYAARVSALFVPPLAE